MGNTTKTAAQKEAEKKARIAAAKEAADNASEEDTTTTTADEVVEEEVDTDTREGLVPDPKIPEPAKPDAITEYDLRLAIDKGLPPLPKRYTQAYLDLRNIYVLFIRQNPQKWNVEWDDIKSALADLKKLEVK